MNRRPLPRSGHDPAEPLPGWWGNLDRLLVYITFGTVLGYMAEAADVYRVAFGSHTSSVSTRPGPKALVERSSAVPLVHRDPCRGYGRQFSPTDRLGTVRNQPLCKRSTLEPWESCRSSTAARSSAPSMHNGVIVSWAGTNSRTNCGSSHQCSTPNDLTIRSVGEQCRGCRHEEQCPASMRYSCCAGFAEHRRTS